MRQVFRFPEPSFFTESSGQPVRPRSNNQSHKRSEQIQPQRVSNVLLVGEKEFFLSHVSSHLFLGAQRARVAGMVAGLSDALPRLRSGAIDVVWLSRQFLPEELLLFAADAKRSGYQGVILQTELAGCGSNDLAAPCKRKPIRTGDFVIDLESYRVWVRGVEAQLTPQEFALLTHFSKHPRELLIHAHLLETMWGDSAAPMAPLRVLVQTLRSKVETTIPPRYIVTQHRLGYRFNPSPYPLT